MRRRAKIILAALALIVATAGIASLFLTTTKIETLHDPIAVKGWMADGLLLIDGRILPLPLLRALPGHSAALSEITKRGVEIGSDGRVYGLVRVHHWCGNDPVREHIARVDISDVMIFLGIGEIVEPGPEVEPSVQEPDGAFSKWGWRFGEFHEFESWRKSRNSADQPNA